MTSRYCGEEAAKQAEEEFERVFAQKGAPDEMTRLRWPCQDAQVPLIDLLARLSITKSKADARRTIEQGGVSLDGTRVSDPLIRVDISSPHEVQLKVGKRGFYIVELFR